MKATPECSHAPSSSSWRRRSTLGEALNGEALGKGHHVLAVARAVGVSTRAARAMVRTPPGAFLTHRLRTHVSVVIAREAITTRDAF